MKMMNKREPNQNFFPLIKKHLVLEVIIVLESTCLDDTFLIPINLLKKLKLQTFLIMSFYGLILYGL